MGGEDQEVKKWQTGAGFLVLLFVIVPFLVYFNEQHGELVRVYFIELELFVTSDSKTKAGIHKSRSIIASVHIDSVESLPFVMCFKCSCCVSRIQQQLKAIELSLKTSQR